MRGQNEYGMSVLSLYRKVRNRIQTKVGRPCVWVREEKTICRQCGISLLEIMITLVIVSLGMLGLAGLQLTGLQNNRDAYSNAIASQVLQDVCERLSIDPTTRATITGVTVVTVAGNAADCDSGAGNAFADRVACLASALPGGTARMRRIVETELPLYVAVIWDDPKATIVGWSGDDANAACDAAEVGKRCVFTIYMP